ncbi:MAG: hypothetical protein A2Y03_06535 [Omnitrophica WOR_2 bacterium GWF2_38_59]|nr:MAG: hypothetical protein A2Y03_06535 [Omnitrophica WOR_2 bacterium GWF2_38_59]OGX50492.1 MAG: hypothetical protein A2243_02040 [Omnitrophica WOR_2 bacterium RIFOXYA2_FULL_38_17]OGX52164.1 MAG: hypothetical protein A2267_06770 [Omnitrophica WOR_2 bacterium RIFOXYA12_FULL_38_10]OGX59501.1 MAG: hypothetical protein A2306_09665 [Omnitrophica WOR_2 bacterium RIFOXYB2_FULL_38_16]HBG62032.1 hypothetical protein [Candidatus Omnitrophota bacterium]
MKDKIEKRISATRRIAGRNFAFFRKEYFSHYCDIPDSVFHEELSHDLSKMTLKRSVKFALAAPRDSGKSTIISAIYVIYCICYKLEDFIVIISNTSEQAASFLCDIKKEFEMNEKLISDFPDVCEKGKPPRWSRREIVTRNGVKVLALGSNQQIRGRRNKSFRPSLIILDDVETDESAKNPESYHKLEDWITKAVLKAGTSETNVIFVGTIHHYGSLLAQFTSDKSHPGWSKGIYRSIISYSSSPDLWQRWIQIFNYQEFYKDQEGPDAARLFFEDNQKGMLMGTEVLWPEKRGYYDLMVMREEDGYLSFDSEMQNDPVNPRDCLFNLDEMHYWDDKFASEEELIASFANDTIWYGSCDPSMGKHRNKGDFSAIITIVKNRITGTIYVISADIARRDPDKIINDVLMHHRIRQYKEFSFESNNFQEYLSSQLMKRSQEEGIYLPLKEIKHTSDKTERIMWLQLFLKKGTIQLSRKHHTLLEQMKFFPKGKYDDGLDALEMVFHLCYNNGSNSLEIFERQLKNMRLSKSRNEIMKRNRLLVY